MQKCVDLGDNWNLLSTSWPSLSSKYFFIYPKTDSLAGVNAEGSITCFTKEDAK